MTSVESRIQRGDPNNEVIRQASHLSPDELLGLLRHSDRDVRWFVIANAVQISPALAPQLLEDAFLHDRDEDNRTDALSLLAEADPRRARKHLVRIRRRLTDRDWATAMSALWVILRLRDTDSLPALDEAHRHWAGDGVGKAAAIAASALRGEHQSVIDQMRSHAHVETPWLSRAAVSIGTPELIEAVEWAAVELPDDECRHYCQQDLERFRRSRSATAW